MAQGKMHYTHWLELTSHTACGTKLKKDKPYETKVKSKVNCKKCILIISKMKRKR